MDYLAALLPSACVAGIFYFAMRAMFKADRTEREAFTRAEREVGEAGPGQELRR